MKKRWLLVLILTLTCIVVVLTVSWQLTSVDKLLRPPKPYGEDLLVQQAFENHMTADYQLKSANRGNNNTAYNIVDIDGNGTEIAVVIYSDSLKPNEICIYVLKDSGNGWECISDIYTGCSDIEYIDFLDINNDSDKEIVIQCSLQSVVIYNRLFVYDITDKNNVEKIYECDYDLMKITDIDDDGFYEIVKVENSTLKNSDRYKMSVLDYKKNTIRARDSIFLDESIKELSSIKIDEKLNGTDKMIYLDGYKSSDASATYFYIWDNLAGELLSVDESSPYSGGFVHNMSINCKDINDDGFVEFPREVKFTDSEIISSENIAEPVTAVLWSQADKSGGKAIIYNVYNNIFDYILVFDTETQSKITYEYDVDKNVLTVYSLNKNNKRDEKIFSLYSTQDDLKKYEKIDENDGIKYYVSLHGAAKKYGFDIDKIKELLIFR